MACSRSAGRAVSTIQPRISLPPRDEGVDIVDVQRGQAFLDAFGQAALFEVVLEGVGGGGKATRHGHAKLGQVADHFAERSVLAADLAQVGHAQRVEPKHQIAQRELLRSRIVRCAGGPREESPLLSAARLSETRQAAASVQAQRRVAGGYAKAADWL